MLPTFFLRPSQQAPVPSLKIAPFTPSQATKNFALLWFSLLKALALSFVNAGPQSATGQAHASRGERLGQQEGESLHGARWVGSFTGRANLMPLGGHAVAVVVPYLQRGTLGRLLVPGADMPCMVP